MFTGALLAAMEQLGHCSDLDSLLRHVRDDVVKTSTGLQEPCFSSNLGADQVFLVSVVGMLSVCGGEHQVPLVSVWDAVAGHCWAQVWVGLSLHCTEVGPLGSNSWFLGFYFDHRYA